jgi:molybdopterin molybdotransferase
MIPFNDALNIVMNQVRPLEYESVPLHEACGRILARDVACDMDIPPFDKSAMDGYACRQADLPGPLRVIETIKAGIPPLYMVNRGECAKIMTGAMVPNGADCVIMVEHTEETGEGGIRLIKTTTGENICYRGEDVRSGDVILHQGTRLGPHHIAVLATAGCAHPMVARLPKVGIIATGDELVEPEVIPAPSQIRNSNGWQLYTQMKQIGATVTYYGIMPDVENILSSALNKALGENDAVLISGGVSMGDYDLVPSAMIKSGMKILFDSIAMKPGKPTTFGIGPAGWLLWSTR